LGLSEEQLKHRLIEDIDIAFDELSNPKHYKKEEDPKFFKSEKTGNKFQNFEKDLNCYPFICKIVDL